MLEHIMQATKQQWSFQAIKIKFYLTVKCNILFTISSNLTLPWFSLVVATNGSSAKSRPKIRRSPADTTVELHDSMELQKKNTSTNRRHKRNRQELHTWLSRLHSTFHSSLGPLYSFYKIQHAHTVWRLNNGIRYRLK